MAALFVIRRLLKYFDKPLAGYLMQYIVYAELY